MGLKVICVSDKLQIIFTTNIRVYANSLIISAISTIEALSKTLPGQYATLRAQLHAATCFSFVTEENSRNLRNMGLEIFAMSCG